MNVNNDDSMSSIPVESLDRAYGGGRESLEFGPNDILSGRTRLSFNHVGNRRFREVVAQSIEDYNTAQSRAEKYSIVDAIIAHVSTSGGRFLKLVDETCAWEELDADTVRQKIAHAIRDATKKKEGKKMRRDSSQREGMAKAAQQVASSTATAASSMQQPSAPSHTNTSTTTFGIGVQTTTPHMPIMPSQTHLVTPASLNPATRTTPTPGARPRETVPPISVIMQDLNKYMHESYVTAASAAGVGEAGYVDSARKPSPMMLMDTKPSPYNMSMFVANTKPAGPTFGGADVAGIGGGGDSRPGGLHGGFQPQQHQGGIYHMNMNINDMRQGPRYELRPDQEMMVMGSTVMGTQQNLPHPPPPPPQLEEPVGAHDDEFKRMIDETLGPDPSWN